MIHQVEWHQLTDDQHNILAEPFTEQEISKALLVMKADASQGLDSLGHRVYNKFSYIVLLMLTTLFNQYLQARLICMDFAAAIGIFLPKKDPLVK